MNYKKMMEEYASKGISSDKMMKAIATLDPAMNALSKRDEELYISTMRDLHEAIMGCHYNEEFAKYDVSQMHHTRPDGSKYKGEHWGIDSVREALKGMSIPSNYNAWDCYVALNANWHDKEVVFKKWFPEDHEQKVIEDAVDFYFNDEDAPNGKIWLYMSAMDYDD